RGTDTPIATRACPRLNDAVISTTDPDIFTGAELGAWRQVRATARLARLGCDAYAYAMLASGHIDLVAETALKPWDWTALVALVEAAGGTVTDWLGNTPKDDGRILAVGDVALTEQALLTLRRAVS
ncbi:MAG TPA: histidinol-phosphatase, partial [Brevundimonas sp.]|nr:histidinol-phosphatase [Brevundimonas sp.]